MPLRSSKDGVLVAVRLQPSAARNRIDGIDRDAAGQRRIRVRATAAPEKGLANKALVRLLAKAWRLPPSAIKVAGGARDRNKLLLVRGDPVVLRERLGSWLDSLTS